MREQIKENKVAGEGKAIKPNAADLAKETAAQGSKPLTSYFASKWVISYVKWFLVSWRLRVVHHITTYYYGTYYDTKNNNHILVGGVVVMLLSLCPSSIYCDEKARKARLEVF